MSDETAQPADEREAARERNAPPSIEDAYASEFPLEDAPGEDEPGLLEPAARALDAGETVAEEVGAERPAEEAFATDAAVDADEAGDADGISVDATNTPADFDQREDLRLGHEVVAHRIAVELKRVEAEVRELLEESDSKRKRKLSGSRRWRELEEDLLAWRFAGRVEPKVLAKLRQLVARRNYLFDRLRFATGTRTRWNS